MSRARGSSEASIKVGDRFEINQGWFKGRKFTCEALVSDEVVKGFDHDLHLGLLVVFEAAFDRKMVKHAVPQAWCRKLEKKAR